MQDCTPGSDDRLAWFYYPLRPYWQCEFALACGSITKTYDLRWTPSDRFVFGFLNITPLQGAVCTTTVSSFDGFGDGSSYRRKRDSAIFAQISGCDQPGDSIYPANVPTPPVEEWRVLSEGARTVPTLAILKAGFASDLARLLLALDEPVTMVDENFDPLDIKKYPILIIPSGGLYGLENSYALRARLEEYTRQGGILIVFAQQHGYEYRVLPGGQIDGRGWREDTGCLNSALRLAAQHPTLIGFDRAEINVHTHGYFTSYPSNATVLLTHLGDGMPAALVYPHGAGQVIATSLYEDWIAGHGQVGADARTFIRGLLNWPFIPANVATYAPGATISLMVTVTNRLWWDADYVRLSLVSPNRKIVQEQTVTVPLTPNQTIVLPFTTTATTPLGLWGVNATLLEKRLISDDVTPMPLRVNGPQFLVVAPPTIVNVGMGRQESPPPSITGAELDVTAALDRSNYADGETAKLSITVTTRSSLSVSNLYATVRYGDFDSTQSISLTGNSTQGLTFAAPADFHTSGTIFYGIYDETLNCALHLNTIRLNQTIPTVTLTLPSDKQIYRPGETVKATAVTTATGMLQVTAPGYSQTLALNGHNTDLQFTLPLNLMRGTYSIDYSLDGQPPHSALFDVAGPWVRAIEGRLLNLPHAPQDEIQADLTVASTDALDVAVRAWILYPDNTQSEEVAIPVTLRAELGNHVIFTIPFSTTQAGPHRLVYYLTDPQDRERAYAAGAEVFDIGPVMALGLHTDSVDFCHTTDPVMAIVTLLATRETTALLNLHLDGALVATHTVNLMTGTQTLTLPVPGPIKLGLRAVRVETEVDGMTSVDEAYFDYGTAGPDLRVSRPSIYEPLDFTTTLSIYVYNRGAEPVPTTTVRVYDGHPAAGGVLIADLTVPPQPAHYGCPQLGQEFYVPWDVIGLAGPHMLYVVADADNAVTETDEDNNIQKAEVQVPRLSLLVSTNKESYERGEPVTITVRAASLQISDDLHIVLTATANLLGFQPFQITEPLTIPAHALVERQYVWKDTRTRGGKYALVVKATGEIGSVQEYIRFSMPVGAEFVAEPLTGTIPLTVTFTDLSSPWGVDKTWRWDFGDGSRVVTETNPIHVYVRPGIYTVTLTTTVPGSAIEWVQRLQQGGSLTDATLLTQAFTFTAMHQNYITVTSVPVSSSMTSPLSMESRSEKEYHRLKSRPLPITAWMSHEAVTRVEKAVCMDVPLRNIRELTSGPDGRIWVLGTDAIAVYDPAMDKQP